MKMFFLVGLILVSGFSKAQDFFRLKESIGMPLRTRGYADIKGSAYFVDTWSKGIIKQVDGKVFNNIDLKYDQLENELIFKDPKGQELAFATPVTEFKMIYSKDGRDFTALFRNGFKPIKGSDEKTYCEILYDGPVKLVKRNIKRIEEYRAYNSATTTKSIIDRIKYYTAKENELTEFKRDKKSIELVFGDKSAAVNNYITENKIDLKVDSDLIKVFEYFSTL